MKIKYDLMPEKDYTQECLEKAGKVGEETKREFFKLFLSGKYNFGESYKMCNISFEAGQGIMLQYIKEKEDENR